jgi:hypothetical protein
MKCAFSSKTASSFSEGATGCAIKDISSESRTIVRESNSESSASAISPSNWITFRNGVWVRAEERARKDTNGPILWRIVCRGCGWSFF